MRNSSLQEGLILEKFVEDCKRVYSGGKICKEGAAETMYDDLTTTPFPHSSAPLKGRR